MKFLSLEVENFRAIKRVAFENIPDMIVIAGPNGCGKSCIFDALRLFKSAYGGYQPNEFQQWFGEFQISLDMVLVKLISIKAFFLHRLTYYEDRTHQYSGWVNGMAR